MEEIWLLALGRLLMVQSLWLKSAIRISYVDLACFTLRSRNIYKKAQTFPLEMGCLIGQMEDEMIPLDCEEEVQKYLRI